MRAIALGSALVTLLAAAPAAGQLHENGRLAWTYHGPPSYKEDVMTAGPDGSDLRRFEPGPATDERDELTPAWSPDGSRLAYSAHINPRGVGIGYYKLHVAAADASGERLVTSPLALEDEIFPDWSPDGSRIAYTVIDFDGDIGLWEISAAGGKPTKLISNAYWPKYSPDGMRLAYIALRPTSTVLRVTTIDGSKTIDLSERPGAPEGPSWSPDGRYVAYSIWKEGPGNYFAELVVARADGSGVPMTLYAPPAALAFHPAWSPDGGSVAFVFRDPDGHPGHDHLLELDLRTRQVRQLRPPAPATVLSHILYTPVWARGAPLPGASVPDVEGPPAPASPAPAALPRLELSGLPGRCARRGFTVRVRSESPLLTLRARVGRRRLKTDPSRGRIRVPLSALSRRPRRLVVVAMSTDGLPLRASARLRRCSAR